MRQRLFLLKELVRRDFQGRYVGSILGFLWSFAQPLWQLVLFSFVFASVMRIKLDAAHNGTANFGIFLFCGLLPWMAIQEGVMRGSTVITDNANLVKKLRFPSYILVLAVVLAALLHEAIAGLLFLCVLPLTGTLPGLSLGGLLLVLPLQLALTLGLAFFFATCHVYFRDTSQLLTMLLNAWFYTAPIVYPLTLVSPRLRGLLAWNPLTAVVELYRVSFLGGNLATVPGLGTLVAAAAACLLVGYFVFRAQRAAFVDVL